MGRVVYTCVFGGFDLVLPPLCLEERIDYVLLTDRASLRVPGWATCVVDPSKFGSMRRANRYFKLFPHRLFPNRAASLYLDGNIRPVGPISELFDLLQDSPEDLLVAPHPRRRFVREEMEQCIRRSLADMDRVREEYGALVADGFQDNGGLLENNVLLRKHGVPGMDAAMQLWWSYIETYSGRDQMSLPHVVRKTGLKLGALPITLREPNGYLHFYPHLGLQTGRLRPLRYLRVYLRAREIEGAPFQLGLRLVQPVLRLARKGRRTLRGSAGKWTS